MTDHEILVRKLQPGDEIADLYMESEQEPELIKTIVFDDQDDYRSYVGGRVTINGLYWHIDAVKVLKCANASPEELSATHNSSDID